MKFTVSVNQFLKDLQVVGSAISNNTVLPILENFLFDLKGDQLHVYASDLETSMSSALKVNGERDGVLAVPAKLLIDTLRALPEQPISFDANLDNFAITIDSTNGEYKLTGESGEEFPNMPEADGASEVSFPSDVLRDAVQKTLFAVSNDELRPAMTGVFMQMDEQGSTFVSTDAHKLVKYKNKDLTSASAFSFIVPKKTMGILKSSLSGEGNVKVSYSGSNAFFQFEDVLMACRLIDAKFPDYNAVIPKDNQNILEVNRLALYNSLRRISLFSSKSTYQVVMNITKDKIVMNAQDLDFSNEGREEMECKYDGDEMAIAFNARFLMEVVNVLEDEEVIIKMSNPSRASLVYPGSADESTEITMLVMPIMVNV